MMNLKGNWKMIVGIILIALLAGVGVWYFMTRDTRPYIVQHYQDVVKKMSDPTYLQQFRDYAKNNLSDPLDDLDYLGLLRWESRHLWYPGTDTDNSYLDANRREMPIDIVSRVGLGRCGEFSLLYFGLCKANNIPIRLIVDNSMSLGEKLAGDHMWNEVYINGRWIHVDPTQVSTLMQAKLPYSLWIDNPLVYQKVWNKDVNEVWTITETETEVRDTTKRYQS